MQGGEVEGIKNLIGFFLVKAGSALIENMAILFAIGVGVGMSEKNDGTGGIFLVLSDLLATISSRTLSFRTGWHSSAASAVLLLLLV